MGSATRALTGVILDQVSETDVTEQLLASLNPVTFFNINISTEVLRNMQKWRILMYNDRIQVVKLEWNKERVKIALAESLNKYS
jgi:hypothetical protein